jgi:hypothetical protein
VAGANHSFDTARTFPPIGAEIRSVRTVSYHDHGNTPLLKGEKRKRYQKRKRTKAMRLEGRINQVRLYRRYHHFFKFVHVD